MSEQLPSHEEVQKYVRELPDAVLSRLPDCIETREAKRLVEVAESLAHQARERVRPA